MNSLAEYKPDEKWLKALEANFSNTSLVKIDPDFRLYLQKPKLKLSNYCRVLKTLLSIDDVSTMQLYADLTQFDVNVGINKRKQFYIKFDDTTMHNESLLTSHIDQVKLFNVSDEEEETVDSLKPKTLRLALSIKPHYIETIVGISRHRVKFSCRGNLLYQSFDAYFSAPRVPVRLMHNALGMLHKYPDLLRYLFPNPDDKQTAPVANKHRFNFINSSIATNAEQLQAINQILAGPNPQSPYIVFGPPGTGKTTTIVEAILQLYMRGGERILVTAGSNSACDTIALKIIESIESSSQFERIDKKRVLVRLLPFTRLKKARKTINPTILKYSNGRESLSRVELSQYGIIVTTLCTIGIVNLLNNTKFTHIFIDEAAASIEPETLLAMVGLRSRKCHVILSGDNKQLGPVVKNVKAVSLGLGKTLMDRLLLNKLYDVDERGNYDQTRQTRLRRNYRSHPKIVGIYNKLYYHGELIPLAPISKVNKAANWEVLPNAKFPIIFQATHGETEREMHSTSSFNKREADVVCWYLMTLLEEENVKVEDIGIVSPYLAQVKLLRKMLRRRELTEVKVGSVESYQGGEKPIIIVSMVSSFNKSTTFLSNPRRVNVLLSRAESLMILIGNPITLSENKDFKYIIELCAENDTLLYNENNLRDDYSLSQAHDEHDQSDTDSDSSDTSSVDQQFQGLRVNN